MKKILTLLVAAAFISPVFAADKEEPKTKRVCVMQKDQKTGKEKEVCKTVKIHKKHEGTKVPEKAPAPAKKDDKKK